MAIFPGNPYKRSSLANRVLHSEGSLLGWIDGYSSNTSGNNAMVGILKG